MGGPAAPLPPGNGVGNQQVWEELSTRLTPADDFFFVSHYGHPVIDPTTWRLGIDGLVARPGSLSLADLKSRPRKGVESPSSARATGPFPSSPAPSATPYGAGPRSHRS